MLELYIMKKCDLMGTRDFFIVDEVRNTIEFGSSHATKYPLTRIYVKQRFITKKELKKVFNQFKNRGYKVIEE